ncbi:MAG: exodeoxyribonuclease VII small subunit [Desulfitobacteriaceae bacterium]
MTREDSLTRQAPNFEAGVERLEQIVKSLEQKEISLESALTLFREGIELVQHCTGLLDKTERQMELLLEDPDGQIRVEAASFTVEG